MQISKTEKTGCGRTQLRSKMRRARRRLGRKRCATVVAPVFSSRCSLSFPYFVAVLGGEFSERRITTQLQSANVCGDGPAVARRHGMVIRGHGAKSVAYHVVKMARRRVAQLRQM